MSKLLEMAVEIVSAHASTTTMSKEDLVAELAEIHTALKAMENGEQVAEQQDQEQQPAVSMKKAFGKDKVYCMICGKGMTTLGRHLRMVHGITPAEYRKQFDIPRTQPLAAKAYSEQRKKMAIERGLGEKLAQARAAKKK
ncbi:MucR family transcriptional regulator [Desulfuromonas acetoxidans]|uniref:Transcriptional regulator, MucR family n=1 Tax=Desulfuromonas acetoxidans (strain DSM 684 / 11070) TaxID=281689 RepID=Q1JZ35_DESA6|nr:MucR family transcriptional regulator [Desulfuromonas acetoxidans]EAT15459.1 transcriptional regulator, MucR family [Desulfuromonas acetoxidans DSM 684]MBF0646982.1 MucR family transcriptional regulator [Desulfuromonas acetoxidans]NVD25887.1 MucR family transcriptional regulator [Desulfuromonas acetoxidans]NVE17821.1 MucR family transcriptional regulator [Desulfuromonas acetoxidans]